MKTTYISMIDNKTGITLMGFVCPVKIADKIVALVEKTYTNKDYTIRVNPYANQFPCYENL